jgi:hypothetical protein
MAPDDRDRIFDKALARHLRPDATTDTGRDPRDDADAPHPGTEVLAAYHERLLAPEQMILWKGHIAGCERCQQVLAHLEATDDMLIEDTQEEPRAQNVLAVPGVELREPATVATPALVLPASPARVADRWSRRFKARPGANWRWLAPAGALAAGLLLWISFHEANAPSSFQLAKNQQMTAPSAVPPPPVSANKETSRAVPSPPEGERSQATRESDALRRNGSVLLDEKRAASMKADKVSAPRAEPSLSKSAAEAGHEARGSNVTGGAVAEEAELQKQKETATSVLSSTDATTEFKDQRADSLDAATNQVKSETFAKGKAVSGATGRQAPQDQNAPAVQPAPAQLMPGAPDVTKLPVGQDATKRVAEVGNLWLSGVATIPAPGGTVLWSAGPAGIIRHSTDSGATWTVQTSSVVADLLAGSAPSDNVCWIVGRSGTILRTADSGAHWQKIHAPVADDFLAVFAVDAMQASISLAQTRYQTKDGGRTWTKLLPE